MRGGGNVGRGGHHGSFGRPRYGRQDSDTLPLPEWAQDDYSESRGTFDSAGKFRPEREREKQSEREGSGGGGEDEGKSAANGDRGARRRLEEEDNEAEDDRQGDEEEGELSCSSCLAAL